MQSYISFHHGIVRLFLCIFLLLVCCLFGAKAEAVQDTTQDVLVPLQVSAGTNLILLAREYCHNPEDWRRIARINKLSSPYVIYANGEIHVPLSLLKTEALAAQVVTVAGVALLEKAAGKESELSREDRILPGDTVLTGENGFVQLLFPNGLYTRVEPNAAFTLQYLISLADGKIKAEAVLEKGKTVHTLKEKLRFNESMRTRTPVVITGIRGTEYRLKVEDAQTTTVETLSGEVAVQSGVNSVQLRADQGLRASSGRKLGKPQILPLPPVVTGIEEVYRTLPVHFHLPSQPNIRATKLRLSSDEAGQATVYEHDAPTGTPLQMSNVPDGQYFAFFTATDNKGFESREQGPHALLIRTKPPAPMVSAPRNGSILWGKFAQVSWLESEQAVQYLVQVGRDAQFNDLVDEQKLATSVYSSPELAPGTYYFRVQSLAADGFASNFSGTVQWEQKEAPTLGGMESTSDELPVLQWLAMGDGWQYDVQVACDQEFTELLVDEQGLASTSYTFPDKLDPGKYYIHLRGVENGEPVTPWTPEQTMTVKNKPKVLQGSLIGALLLGILLVL